MKHILLSFFLFTFLNLNGQEWEQLGSIPFPDIDHGLAFSFDGKGFMIAEDNAFWEYNPETDVWLRIQDHPGPARDLSIGDDYDGKFYFGFGFDWDSGVGGLSDLWVFDPSDYSFTELPRCPCEGRGHPAFVAEQGKIYMGSGTTAFNGDIDDWWVYDIETKNWERKLDIPGGKRHHPFQFGIDNKIYVGGGHKDNWIVYDGTNDSWAPIDDAPKGRVAGAQFSYGDKGYVLSGDNGDHQALPSEELFMEYDPETNEWTSMPPHPGINRWAPSQMIIDGYIYLIGGIDNDYSTEIENTMYRYNLNPSVSANDIVETSEVVDLYPVPFKDELNISINKTFTLDHKVTLYDQFGNVVYNQDASLGKFDFSFLVPGTYYIEIKSKDSIPIRKVIYKM